MTVIVDYGCGNLSSIGNMIKKIGGKAIVTSNPAEIAAAEKIILPGIGAFDTGMSHLNEMGFVEILNNKALKEKVPVLGICLGMQLMTQGSEEGVLKGLSWFDADTLKFNFDASSQLKVPLMGWKYVQQKKTSRLLNGMYETPKFYFVHAYYVRSNREEDILATTTYGAEYTSAFEKDNLFGVQFHPEKSHKYGMKLLQNFIGL